MCCCAIAATTTTSRAAPATTTWPVDGPDDTVCVAAAAVSGWYATADAYEDSVEIRDARGSLIRTITRTDIQSLLPWMTLTGGPDGPAALAFTDTGRNLFILVTDSALPGDGQGSDAVLRFDAATNALSVYSRLEAASGEATFPHLSMAHFKARLYIGTPTGVQVFLANANLSAASFVATIPLPDAGPVRGFTIDRDNSRLYAASATNFYRSNTSPVSWTLVGAVGGTPGSECRAITFADHFGNPSGSQRGLYVLRDGPAGATPHQLVFVPAASAAGTSAFTSSVYTSSGSTVWHDLAATADGAILIAADEDALRLTDTADTRFSLDNWIIDEFNQHVTLARGLIDPDGEPSGWVIDGDVIPAWSRFHPATPDAAAWTVFMLIAADRVAADPIAQTQVRIVLERYAGLATSGPAPLRSADGIFTHWIDPNTGATEAGWTNERATLSTMKIVAAAARAMKAYPDDARIVRAASRIIFRTKNWSAYTPFTTNGMGVPNWAGIYFVGNQAGGPSGGSSGSYNEGIIFVEQAAHFAGTGSGAATAYSVWLDRTKSPSASYIPGLTVTGDVANSFQSAFLSMYPMLLSKDFRTNASWRTHVQNLRWSHAAWTDDFGPQYYTVFSAGTNASSYNADSITSHPEDITTFTSLLALGAQPSSGVNAALNPLAEVVAGYHAYRKGARQTFKTGASLLYRRSNANRTFTPNSCGLPDVTIGGLGLAEVLEPGFVDSTLATSYPDSEQCPVDNTADGLIDLEDVYSMYENPNDLSGDGVTNTNDIRCLLTWLRRNEASSGTTR